MEPDKDSYVDNRNLYQTLSFRMIIFSQNTRDRGNKTYFPLQKKTKFSPTLVILNALGKFVRVSVLSKNSNIRSIRKTLANKSK